MTDLASDPQIESSGRIERLREDGCRGPVLAAGAARSAQNLGVAITRAIAVGQGCRFAVLADAIVLSALQRAPSGRCSAPEELVLSRLVRVRCP